MSKQDITASLWSTGTGATPDAWPSRIRLSADEVGKFTLGLDLTNNGTESTSLDLTAGVLVEPYGGGETGPDEEYLTISLSQR